MTTENFLYSDSLVEITEDSICFRDYYFPIGSRNVRFSEIDNVTEKKPTWRNGKYRIQGTGDLQTWFPKDWHRPPRSTLFFIHLHGSSRCIGFTVENAGLVEQILRGKDLLA